MGADCERYDLESGLLVANARQQLFKLSLHDHGSPDLSMQDRLVQESTQAERFVSFQQFLTA